MRDRDLYAKILDIHSPWLVAEVELDVTERTVVVHVELDPKATVACPTCSATAGRHDSRTRRWRHLDTCQYRTILEAPVPRVRCPDHGVLQMQVPWSEPNSRFTALFEALVIDWLKEASTSAVARMLHMTWHEVDGVMARAVARGLARRGRVSATAIGVDETSFQKRHEYVTVVSETAKDGRVLHVADGRKGASLDEYYESQTPEELAAIESVSMDLSQAYISSTRRHVPDADEKISFDHFHVSQLLTNAVDEVRRKESKDLAKESDYTLMGTRYVWVSSPDNLKDALAATLDVLKSMALKTAKAWAIKELARKLWKYSRRGWARRAWMRWLSWALRCRLPPMQRAARTIRKHLGGILNAIVKGVTNARAESINAKIQKVKRMACGYRNRDRFRNAIYFHLGGLDLYPAAVSPGTHTKP